MNVIFEQKILQKELEVLNLYILTLLYLILL